MHGVGKGCLRVYGFKGGKVGNDEFYVRVLVKVEVRCKAEFGAFKFYARVFQCVACVYHIQVESEQVRFGNGRYAVSLLPYGVKRVGVGQVVFRGFVVRLGHNQGEEKFGYVFGNALHVEQQIALGRFVFYRFDFFIPTELVVPEQRLVVSYTYRSGAELLVVFIDRRKILDEIQIGVYIESTSQRTYVLLYRQSYGRAYGLLRPVFFYVGFRVVPEYEILIVLYRGGGYAQLGQVLCFVRTEFPVRTKVCVPRTECRQRTVGGYRYDVP